MNSNDITAHTQNLSILFVEDNDELRQDTADILNNFFKTVHSCSNGQEALAQYLKFHDEHSTFYNIILSDIQMPLMNGIELTKKIYEINPSQTIIILSAYDDSKYLLSLINLGIEQFIKKPIDYQELLATFLNASKKIDNTSSAYNDGVTFELAKDFIYNKNSKSIIHNNENIYLTKFEIIFLELLTSSLGKIYSNEEIVTYYNSLNENIDSANIRKLVSKLRKKLPEHSLESVYGIGYKLVPYFDA